MIKPLLQNESFLADIAAAQGDPSRLHLWWLGQSGFLIQWEGKHLLLDPYLSDSLTKKYANTDKPHNRMTERVIAPESLNFIDVVTSSHNHTDHLDAETLLPLLRVNPRLQLLIPEANRAFVAERLATKIDFPIGLVAGQTTEIAGFKFHGVPASHPELEMDEAGRHKFLGYVVEVGRWKIYHSGDTLHFSGMEDWLRKFSVDIALLPINGDVPERRVAGNLDGVAAARLAREIGAGTVVPCHYDMFEFNTASTSEFVAECKLLGQPFRILRNGQRLSLP